MRIQARNRGQGGGLDEDFLEGRMLTDGPLVIAHNDDPKLRTPLVVAISHDQGNNWRPLADVETDADLQVFTTTTTIGLPV
jgi:hypothetical protein